MERYNDAGQGSSWAIELSHDNNDDDDDDRWVLFSTIILLYSYSSLIDPYLLTRIIFDGDKYDEKLAGA